MDCTTTHLVDDSYWLCGKYTFTVYPKEYAHGFVVLCFVVVMQSFIMNSHEVFIHIHQGCFAGTGAIVRLPQCQWCKPDGYGKISQCITTTKHNKAKTLCIFLGIYCMLWIAVYRLFNPSQQTMKGIVLVIPCPSARRPVDGTMKVPHICWIPFRFDPRITLDIRYERDLFR